MRRTKEEAAATRLCIIRNALELFSENGVSATSLVDVAKRTGVTRGAIYWHFKNKWELFEAVWRHYSQPLDELSAASQEETQVDPLGKLAEIIRYILIGMVEQQSLRQMFLICMRESSSQGEYPQRVKALFHQINERRKNTLANAVRKGQLPENFDIDAGAMFLRSSVDGLIINWIRAPEAFALPPRIDQFVTGILAALKCCVKNNVSASASATHL